MKTLGPLAIALALAFPASSSKAQEIRPALRPDGTHIFDARFFNMGDGYFMEEQDEGEEAPSPKESTWNLSSLQKDKIFEAIRYWGELITPVPGQLPGIINIGTSNREGNAAGGSDPQQVGDMNLTQIQAAIQGHPVDQLTFGSHAMFYMGRMNWDTLENVLPSQLPRAGDVDLTAVAFHELAHGLGISSSIANKEDDEAQNTPHFGERLNSFDMHIRNSNGDAPKAGQAVLCIPCANPIDDEAFDMRDDRGYFVGAHVEEVLQGAMPGIPLKILTSEGAIDDYMSHLELKNSLMSHQNYRNYTNFMEAELAVLQDMGYDIDRRNFFGYSIYGDNGNIDNHRGFFKRGTDGTTYLGEYNTSTLGLGLHIYGKQNTVLQQGDLLSIGTGGAGIRVDGSDNVVIIPADTRVHANGLNGRGVMFTYGKNHVLVQQGDVQATGEYGIAASFDFGNNALGNKDDYRGSFIHTGERANEEDLSQELNGALVDRFDLTGSLAGKSAAIFISENALVNQINVMRGASIQGNIYSNYAERDQEGQLRLTTLSFGRLPDGHGLATTQADPSFRLAYQGDIQGANIALSMIGGVTSLNGNHVIQQVGIEPGATLGGSSRYVLAEDGVFRNDGTILPGNAPTATGRIEIVGDYAQGATGRLLMKVDGQGGHDTLQVSGHAGQGGRLSLMPLAGWYANDWRLSTDALLQASARSGAFSAVDAELSSPTLRFQATALQNGNHALTISRDTDAYSRYAADDNGRQAGQALYRMAAIARADAQPLFSAIDFSAPDGSTVRSALSQLSPSAYNSMFAGSLQRERRISDIVNADRYAPVHESADRKTWQAFVVPFGGKSRQDAGSSRVAYDATTYGVVAGIEMRDPRKQAWTSGIHAAVSEQTVKPRDAADSKGRTTTFELGAHLRYAPDDRAGLHAFGQGRVGIEQGKLNRRVQINAYTAKHDSDWNGFTGTLEAGVGYRWALSPSVSAGPLAALEYNYLRRPGVTESGPDATRLQLESGHAHALQSRIGIGGDFNVPLKNESQLKANLLVTWDHEILDKDIVQRATFAGYSGIDLESRNRLTARDALGVRGGLEYQTKGGVRVGASLASQWFGSGDKALTGNLNVSWRF
jgi:subtilase-type serine protease